MLVRRADSDESLSKGGIVMPANADRPTHVSEIITLGDGLEVPSALARVMRTKVDPANRPQLSLQDLGDAAQFLAMPQFSAAVGDLVLHSRNAGYAITIDGEQLKLLSDGEILGIWRRPGVEGRTTAPPMR
jgi:co-chaperonin GroES (HSP10)